MLEESKLIDATGPLPRWGTYSRNFTKAQQLGRPQGLDQRSKNDQIDCPTGSHKDKSEEEKNLQMMTWPQVLQEFRHQNKCLSP